ncbi:MAG TPA: hypothetical protein VGM30_19625 [Puia sp.]|jgi:hypothetical protein
MANCTYNECLKAPIPEKCFYFCIYQILLKANPQEKVSVLGFSRETAERIFKAFNTYHAKNYEQMVENLSSSQIEELVRIFRTITQAQLDYFANR